MWQKDHMDNLLNVQKHKPVKAFPEISVSIRQLRKWRGRILTILRWKLKNITPKSASISSKLDSVLSHQEEEVKTQSRVKL